MDAGSSGEFMRMIKALTVRVIEYDLNMCLSCVSHYHVTHSDMHAYRHTKTNVGFGVKRLKMETFGR